MQLAKEFLSEKYRIVAVLGKFCNKKLLLLDIKEL
jgi:hypothetical protein